MREPSVLAARYPSLRARSATGWAPSLVALLHAQQAERTTPLTAWGRIVTFEPAVLELLRLHGIEARIEDYGPDLPRFETDLASCNLVGPARYPLVSVPALTEVDWGTGGLQIRTRTFVVDYEDGTPVFLTREDRTGAILRITLKQIRLLHHTWQRWPIVLPSMLLTVLWHRRRSS